MQDSRVIVCSEQNGWFPARSVSSATEASCSRSSTTVLCAVKCAGQQWVQVPPGTWIAPPGSNRSNGRGNEAVEASGVDGREGDLAKQPPKRRVTMRKTAIVTDASRGIGRTIALRLAADGFGGGVNYAGNAGNAEEVVNQITNAGGRALAVQANVANPEDVKQLFEKTIKTFGQIGVVVNNAAIMPLSPIAKGYVETFDKVIGTNLRGTFLVLSQAAHRLAEGGSRMEAILNEAQFLMSLSHSGARFSRKSEIAENQKLVVQVPHLFSTTSIWSAACISRVR